MADNPDSVETTKCRRDDLDEASMVAFEFACQFAWHASTARDDGAHQLEVDAFELAAGKAIGLAILLRQLRDEASEAVIDLLVAANG